MNARFGVFIPSLFDSENSEIIFFLVYRFASYLAELYQQVTEPQSEGSAKKTCSGGIDLVLQKMCGGEFWLSDRLNLYLALNNLTRRLGVGKGDTRLMYAFENNIQFFLD
jgi:hypothetical protein